MTDGQTVRIAAVLALGRAKLFYVFIFFCSQVCQGAFKTPLQGNPFCYTLLQVVAAGFGLLCLFC